jgi:menaquinone-dependent protoporphyrinogen oxidase
MRVLVTAASKHGATAEIADALGKGLAARGLDVVVADPATITNLEGYDAAVVGSAVYAGRWLEPAKDLIDRLEDLFRARAVWLFSSGPVGNPLKPLEDPADAAPIAERVGARGHRVFAAKLDSAKLGFVERAMVKVFRVEDGDFRDWNDIDAWASEIADSLRAGPELP